MSASGVSQSAETIKALFPSAAAHGQDILIRGDQAARAKPIDLVRTNTPQQIQPVGPWADDLEQTREEARSAGFAQGREEGNNLGLKEGQAQAEREVSRIRADAEAQVESLRAAVESLSAQIAEQIAGMSEQVSVTTAELALEIAEAVLGHEVSASEDPGAAAIARCLELAPATGELNANLNPDDLMVLGDIPGLEGRTLTLTPDSSLQRGDAVVTVNEATIDARLSESLRRVAEALR